MQYLLKHRQPVAAVIVTILALLVAMFIIPNTTRAAPLELTYQNNITSAAGDLTLAISGPLYVMFHGRFTYHDSSLVKSCHSYMEPMPVASYGLMVRAPLDVINVATGASYRLHGHFKDSKNKQGISGGMFCGEVMAWSWTDTVDIITPEGVRVFTLKFYTEVNMPTGDLIHIEVETAQLN